MGSPLISSTLPFLLPFFITILFTGESQARNLQQLCSSSCGDINIKYPFRLNGDPSTCGDPDYELSCENDTPFLYFHTLKLQVKGISYTEQVIRVVDSKLANGGCGLPSKRLDGAVSADFRYRGFVNNSLVAFLNCSVMVKDEGFMGLPCLTNNGSNYVYAIPERSDSLYESVRPCDWVSMTLVASRETKFPSYEALQKVLADGFDLGWSIQCRDCVNLGYDCDFYTTETGYYTKCFQSYDYTGIFIAVYSFVASSSYLSKYFVVRFMFLPLPIYAFLLHKYFTTPKDDGSSTEKVMQNQRPLMPKRYTYNEILAMTAHVREKLGESGFGSVFKGQLPGGCLVAVKLLERIKVNEKDFMNGISILGGIHHVNAISLVGYCCEASKLALVYEYMPNGSVDKYVLSRGGVQMLCWEKLYQVVLGTAKGIQHLHTGLDVSVLHLNIKPKNVLLDRNLVPKVTDFGFAMFCSEESDFVRMSTLTSTTEYVAPELMSDNTMAASRKSDVYSFGMLLLEMVRRRKNMEASSSKINSLSCLHDYINNGEISEIRTVTANEETTVRKLCIVGLWCIQTNSSERPSMFEVVKMLEGDIDDLQIPPKPSLPSPPDMPKDPPPSDSLKQVLIPEWMERS